MLVHILYCLSKMLQTRLCTTNHNLMHKTRHQHLLLHAGIALGFTYPLIYSLVGDLAPPASRSTASGVVTVFIAVGTIIGQGVSGFIGPDFGWRAPFLFFGILVPGAGALSLFFAREPPRGMAEEALHNKAYDESMTLAKVKDVLRVPSNVLFTLQGFTSNVPWA